MTRRFLSDRERRTYQSWADAKCRCRNPRHRRFANYGGRGIEFSPLWDRFESFVTDLGLKPDGFTLERIENDGHYEPGNCRWATYREQARNARSNKVLEFGGRRQTLAAWADEVGLLRTTLSNRIHVYGWPLDVALSAPIGAVYNVPESPVKAKYVEGRIIVGRSKG